MLNSPMHEDMVSNTVPKGQPGPVQGRIHNPKTGDPKLHEIHDSNMNNPKTGDSDMGEALVPRSFPAEQITFEKGLIGFSDYRDYGLMELPDERLSQFHLLQSIDDPDLSFLLLPLAMEDGPIAAEDLDKALENLGIAKEDAVVLAIVTVRKTNDQFSATANIRAPVVIDLKTRQGVQYVFANTNYAIRHPVS